MLDELCVTWHRKPAVRALSASGSSVPTEGRKYVGTGASIMRSGMR
jgi:hypothetical protein